MSARQVDDLERTLRQERYAPAQLASLLDMDEYVIRTAVWEKKLPAQMLGKTIVSLRRGDVLAWLDRRR